MRLLSLFACLLVLCEFHLAAHAQKKLWTVIVYMAADNDLYLFADRNIEQMKQVGSNELVSILIHLDIKKPQNKKISKRLLVHKNRIEQIGPDLCLDSGNEQTLFDALLLAHEEFPSEHLAVIFWNHGSGDLNPVIGKSINPSQLFYYNSSTRMIELDRSVGFLDFVDSLGNTEPHLRGVCFDETMNSYLDDEKIKGALSQVCAKRGKKIDIILFDACLMAGIGTAWLVAPYADYMVASEELALGPGYDYTLVISALSKKPISPRDFAKHTVRSYEKTYGKITQDYTQSAIDLSLIPQLAQNINDVALLLSKAFQLQRNNSVKNAIRQSMMCVAFDEPSYRDIGSFYTKLLPLVASFQLTTQQESNALISQLQKHIREGIQLLSHAIIQNATGNHLKGATGLYLYLPSKRIHSSYRNTDFARNNNWYNFLEIFLS